MVYFPFRVSTMTPWPNLVVQDVQTMEGYLVLLPLALWRARRQLGQHESLAVCRFSHHSQSQVFLACCTCFGYVCVNFVC